MVRLPLRLVCFSWLALGLLGCDDDPEPAGPVDVSIETFNVGLAGAFIPNEAARRQPVIDALAQSDADFICLQEVWEQSDKDLIAEAVAENFPYVVSFEHDLDTPVDDPTDQTGTAPEPYTDAPCEDEAFQSIVDDALACMIEHCSTIPEDPNGRTVSTACAEENCVGSIMFLLLTEDPAQLRCYGCVAAMLPTNTFAEIEQECKNNVNAGLSYNGQSGVMLLSRHPLREEGAFVLPSTWIQRPIVYATADLPNGAAVDVYCNHLTPYFDGLTYPYTGRYGSGDQTAGGWGAEQLLQAEKLIALVEERTGPSGSAVILGDFNSGREQGDTLHEEAVETLDLLESAFTPAVTSGYAPLCTHCPGNGNTSDDADPVWIDHIFLYNFPASSVLSTERIYDEDVVPVEGGDPVPLSDHYGLRSVVTVEAPPQM